MEEQHDEVYTLSSSKEHPCQSISEALKTLKNKTNVSSVLGEGILSIKASFYWQKSSVVHVPLPSAELQGLIPEPGKLPAFQQILHFSGTGGRTQYSATHGTVRSRDTSPCQGKEVVRSNSTNSISPERSRTFGTGSRELKIERDISLEETATGYSSITSSGTDPSSVVWNLVTAEVLGENLNLRRYARKAQRRYRDATPSNFCHVCQKAQRLRSHIVCANIRRGLCRKVVCNQCCVENGWDWNNIDAYAETWLCPHCTDTCPPRAQCFTYERTNERRRNGTMKKRKLSRNLEIGSVERPHP